MLLVFVRLGWERNRQTKTRVNHLKFECAQNPRYLKEKVIPLLAGIKRLIMLPVI